MKFDCKKCSIALAVSMTLLFNSYAFAVVEASEATNQNSVVEEYDPFAKEEQQAPKEKLTMRERLAKMQEEERKASMGITIDNVLPGHIYIPKGTKLKVELVKDANSKVNKKNQILDIKMVENLIINGVVVIPKDTIGTAYVYEVQKAGGFGRKGVLRIAGKEIKTLNNVTVPLRQGLEGKGNTDGGAVAVAAAVSLVGGLFMKGSNINYPAGTDFEVEVMLT